MVFNTAKQNAVQAIPRVLEHVAKIQQQAEHIAKLDNSKYKKLAIEALRECRAVDIKLNLYDKADENKLEKWCANHHTEHRLKAMEDSLASIEATNELEAKQKKESQHASPTKKTALDQELKIQKLETDLAIHRLRARANYNPDFAKYIGRDQLIENHLLNKEVLKNLKKAREMGSEIADVAGKSKKLFEVVNKSAHALQGGSEASRSVMQTLQGVATAIPIVVAITSCFSFVEGAFRSFLEKKGASEKAVTTIMAGAAVGAAALMIVFPVAALWIGAGMIAAGGYMDYVRPYFQNKKKIKELKSELTTLDNRKLELSNDDTQLNGRELKALKEKLIEYGEKNPSVSIAELKAAKAFLEQDGIAIKDLKGNNPAAEIVNKSLNLDGQKTLNHFLMDNTNECQHKILRDITALEKKNKSNLFQSINTFFATAGAIMLAIPFPPVMIAGAALLLSSTVAGVLEKNKDPIIKFVRETAAKTMNFFRGIYEKFKNRPQNDISLSVIKSNKETESAKAEMKNTTEMTASSPAPQQLLQAGKIISPPKQAAPLIIDTVEDQIFVNISKHANENDGNAAAIHKEPIMEQPKTAEPVKAEDDYESPRP